MTTSEVELIEKLKQIALDTGRPLSKLLEEAIQLLAEEYKERANN